MKKQFCNYAIFWVALVGLFNLICFITPSEINGVSKYSGGFWSGYGFITAAFVLHFIYAYFAFSEKNKEKRVLNTPATVISFFELGLMIVVGSVCMSISSIPYWLGIILCYIVLIISVVSIISVKTVRENTAVANSNLNAKTYFFRELTDSAQELVSAAKTNNTKQIVRKVYEAIRYSDTVSSDETRDDEIAIRGGLEALKVAVADGIEEDKIQKKVDEMLQLIEKRNNKCKASKRRV